MTHRVDTARAHGFEGRVRFQPACHLDCDNQASRHKRLDVQFSLIQPASYQAAMLLQNIPRATAPCSNHTLVDAGRFAVCYVAATTLPSAAGTKTLRFSAGFDTEHDPDRTARALGNPAIMSRHKAKDIRNEHDQGRRQDS